MGPMGEDRHEDLGGYRVDFMSLTQGGDMDAMLKGLPDDQCRARIGVTFSRGPSPC